MLLVQPVCALHADCFDAPHNLVNTALHINEFLKVFYSPTWWANYETDSCLLSESSTTATTTTIIITTTTRGTTTTTTTRTGKTTTTTKLFLELLFLVVKNRYPEKIKAEERYPKEILQSIF